MNEGVKIIGWLGTVLLIGAYGANSLGYLDSSSILYPILNLLAAIFLGIRVFADKNYSNFILEIFWGIIAILSIAKIYF